jgi:hypothetical protein
MSAAADRLVEVFANAGADFGSPEAAADVEIDASVSADELRPLERPRTTSRVYGDVRREDMVQRSNVPGRLEPGSVYRNVRVRRRIAGRLIG